MKLIPVDSSYFPRGGIFLADVDCFIVTYKSTGCGKKVKRKQKFQMKTILSFLKVSQSYNTFQVGNYTQIDQNLGNCVSLWTPETILCHVCRFTHGLFVLAVRFTIVCRKILYCLNLYNLPRKRLHHISRPAFQSLVV